MGIETNKENSGYGINIGSMLVTWGIRFVYGRNKKKTGGKKATKSNDDEIYKVSQKSMFISRQD